MPGVTAEQFGIPAHVRLALEKRLLQLPAFLVELAVDAAAQLLAQQLVEAGQPFGAEMVRGDGGDGAVEQVVVFGHLLVLDREDQHGISARAEAGGPDPDFLGRFLEEHLLAAGGGPLQVRNEEDRDARQLRP